MDYVGKLLSNVSSALDINAATLSGAIDIVVVRQPDGSLKCSPFHVRFGKLQLLKSREKIVTITVNDVEAPFKMKVGPAGEAFFVETCESGEPVPTELATSPIGSPLPSPRLSRRLHKLDDTGPDSGSEDGLSDSGARDHRAQSTDSVDASRSWVWRWGALPVRSRGNSADSAPGSKGVGSNHEPDLDDLEAKAFQNLAEDAEDTSWVKSVLSRIFRKKNADDDEDEPDYLIDDDDDWHIARTPSDGEILDFIQSLYPDDEDAAKALAAAVTAEKRAAAGLPVDISSPTAEKLEQVERKSIDELIDYWHHQTAEVASPSRSPVHETQESLLVPDPVSRAPNYPASPGTSTDDTLSSLTSEETTPLNLQRLHRLSGSGNFVPPPRDSDQVEAGVARIATTVESGDADDEGGVDDHKDDGSDEGAAPAAATTEGIRPGSTGPVPSVQFSESPVELPPPQPSVVLHASDFSRDLRPPDAAAMRPNVSSDELFVLARSRMTPELDTPSLPHVESQLYFDTSQDPVSSPPLAAADAGAASAPAAARADTPKPEYAMSLCASAVRDIAGSPKDIEAAFAANLVSEQVFFDDPSVLFDSELMFRIDNHIVPAVVAGPVFISHMIYGKPIPAVTLTKLLEENEVYRIDEQAHAPVPVSMESIAPQTSAVNDSFDTDDEDAAPIWRKTLHPSSEMIEKLNLNEGANSISFSVFSKLQGRREVNATIWLWKLTSKVVISDIDGTITRSDALGHVLPLIGRDWSHAGVADLYTNITRNGYKILYLTSRAVGQADTTRGYITTLKQGRKMLPPGPIVMSPDRLFTSFHREIIRRKPEEFKIACLLGIRSLFPSDYNPFHAGFGNRNTDLVSYRAAGVPSGRIFIINPAGEVRVASSQFSTTYAQLSDSTHEIFPNHTDEDSPSPEETFTDFNYWRAPEADIDPDEEAELLGE